MDKTTTITAPTEDEAAEAIGILCAFLKCNGGNKIELVVLVDNEERVFKATCTKEEK